jgi:hypothetical protein
VDNRIIELLKIVGAEDGSDAGEEGVVEVGGDLATALLESCDWTEQLIARYRGKQVRIGRQGGALEFWCDGLRVGGRGVRSIVHSAARRIASA